MSQVEAEELRCLWTEYTNARSRIAVATWTNGRPLEESTLRGAIADDRRASKAIERIQKIYRG